MHFIITDPWFAKRQAVHLHAWQLAGLMVALVAALITLSVVSYHLLFVHGARQGWPVIAPLVELLTTREREGQERYMKENLTAMAERVGALQARVVQLESLGERVASLAGVVVQDSKLRPGSGGPLVRPDALTLSSLREALATLDARVEGREQFFSRVEADLFGEKMRKILVPTNLPVANAPIGSGFGYRSDPITGERALHTGLDFSADSGTPIFAAAGGVVTGQEFHPAYGNLVELDHGNGLVTRYAHASRVLVKLGQIVKRGQTVAEVGNTGRSTGAHLHFEVWFNGVAQDPQHFLFPVAGSDKNKPLASRSAGSR
ncbi:M23 family metallopeptidase [Hydrogenophaga soli]